jgi:hypothetical protein
MIRMVNMWGGRELIGEGQDTDGPHVNGRTGTWFLAAGGDDLDGDGTLSDDICDRNDDGWCANDSGGMIKAGGSSGAYTCKRDDDTGGCAITVGSHGGATFPTSKFGQTFTGAVLGDILNDGSNWMRICLDNRLSNGGVCSGNQDIPCTANSGGRLSTTTGSCVINDSGIGGGTTDYGTCEGLVDAMVTEMEAQIVVNTTNPTVRFDIQSYPTAHRGLGSEIISAPKQHALARVGAFQSDGTIVSPTLETCLTNGKYVYMSLAGGTNKYMYPSSQPVWDASVQPTDIVVVDETKFNNDGGGFSHINVMPAHWLGRDSTNDAADCSTFGNGGTQDDGVADSACDSVGPIHLGAGGGGDGYAFSLIDGTSAGLYAELGWSSLHSGSGLASDASSWWFHDNVWRDWTVPSGTFMAWNYGPGAVVERETYININASRGFLIQPNPGFVMRDSKVISSNFNTGMFNLSGARQALISGLSGYGNRGIPWLIAPRPNLDTWDVVVEKVDLAAHTFVASSGPEGLIVRYDDDGSATYLGGNVDNVVFRDHHYSLAGEQRACMIFLEGGQGGEVDPGPGDAAAHGFGRTVDDDRHQLSFENISIERVAESTAEAQTEFFCLGNSHNDEQNPTEAMTLTPNGIFESLGGMPRWVGLSIDGQQFPDNPYRSIRTLDTILDGNDDVDDANEELDWADHGLRDRDVVTYNEVANGGVTGLTDTNIYYVRYITKDSLRLYDDRAIADDEFCTASVTPWACCTGAGTGTCSSLMDLTDDADGTFTITTGREPDCDTLPQGIIIRTHSATAEGNCEDNVNDTSILDGGGDNNALCKCDGAGSWSAL